MRGRGRGRGRDGGRAGEGEGHPAGTRREEHGRVRRAGSRAWVGGVVVGGREGGRHASGGYHVGDLPAVFSIDLGPEDGGYFVPAAGAGGEVGGGVQVLAGGVLEEADLLVVREALGDTHGVALQDVAARVGGEGRGKESQFCVVRKVLGFGIFPSFVLVSSLPPSLPFFDSLVNDVPGVEAEGGAFFQTVVQHACC